MAEETTYRPNECTRLANMLEQLKKRTKDRTLAHALAVMFLETDPNKDSLSAKQRRQVSQTLLEVTKSIDLIELEIRSTLPTDTAHELLHDFEVLREAFSPSGILCQWGDFICKIPDSAIRSLRIAATHLPGDGSVTKDEADVIKKQIASLIQSVRASAINKRLRIHLLGLLAQMEEAINFYWIHGARAFRQSYSTAVGEVATNASLRSLGEDDSEYKNTTLKDEFINVINGCANIARRTNDIYGPLLAYTGQIVAALEKIS